MYEYFLMNKDVKLLHFRLLYDALSGYTGQELQRYSEYLPPGFSSISDWIDSRNYAKHKLHLKRWLREWQIDNTKGFLDITHALGLNDTLWVKDTASLLSWRDVSLYSNNFNDVVANTAFSSGLHGLKLSSTSPEFTSEGSFEKCWIRDKSEDIHLYKKGSSGFANAGLEPYSEYYASQISRLLCKDALSYNLRHFKGWLVSDCKMFTSEAEGFIPIYKYIDTSRTVRLTDVLSIMENLGLAEDFRDMIVLDAVILNHDRHLGNFGFIVDNDTFRIKRFAPVFDHNMALLARGLGNALEEEADYIRSLGHKGGADFVAAAKSVITSRTRSILHSLQDFSFVRHKSYNLPAKRLRFLESMIRHQVRSILA